MTATTFTLSLAMGGATVTRVFDWLNSNMTMNNRLIGFSCLLDDIVSVLGSILTLEQFYDGW